MRWSMGGWVEVRRPTFSPPKGLAIITWEALATFGFSGSIGARAVPVSSLRSAEARASGSSVSRAPSSSASYSRVRLMAIWMIEAASGATRAMSRLPMTLPPRSRLPPKNSANWAMEETTPAMAPATEEVRMSRLYTCISSCPSTPRSSRSLSSCRMPSVQHTAACSGLRPVAKALGERVGAMYSRGMGLSARVDSSWTIRYMAGASCGVTGRAFMERMAILSLFQYP
ncbi:Uncharacterised protein [Mycobacteroides abscessus subsp. abscessus]|nr:Uncharacterised protein [Mycobacteroides abscessus subsp. abscessus]